MNESTNSAARSFFDFTDATASVLDLLEKQLPDCAVFVAYHDSDAELLRIVDFRGEPQFGISNGQTMPLLPGTVVSGAPVDPAPAILANPIVRDVRSFIGIPLLLNDGEHFGTLCAISNVGDRFARNDVELLTVLGRVIVNELDREVMQQQMQQRHDDLVRHNRRLRVDAFTDALTGVANRRGFERALAREWKLSRRGTVPSFLTLVDLDEFKAVNDRYGHAAGDEMLRLCAQALKAAGRETDVIGRIGGDEFAAILVGCTTAEEAQIFATRASEHLEELLHESEAKVTFSAGSQGLADSPSPLRAMELADQAMYWHKRNRNGGSPRGTALASKIKGGAKAPRQAAPNRAPARIPAKAMAAARRDGSATGINSSSDSPADNSVARAQPPVGDDALIDAASRKPAPIRNPRG
ncbi:MAG: sensor domain-containing diguanylate cyclase [Actinobacteria bacterium]|nr:sensor domain-containing diguanylate cyclase [Actinomycetota bacterium]